MPDRVQGLAGRPSSSSSWVGSPGCLVGRAPRRRSPCRESLPLLRPNRSLRRELMMSLSARVLARRAAVSALAPTMAKLGNTTRPSGARCVVGASGAAAWGWPRLGVPGSAGWGSGVPWSIPSPAPLRPTWTRARHSHESGKAPAIPLAGRVAPRTRPAARHGLRVRCRTPSGRMLGRPRRRWSLR
jgi:hypothetical protein